MITTAELLARKAKAERDLVMAKATIEVVDELLAVSNENDLCVPEEKQVDFCEETADEATVDGSY